MKRDKKGRFAGKDDDNRSYQFTITFPSIRNIILWVLIIIIVSSPQIKKLIILLNNLVNIYLKYISLNF